MDHIAPPGTRNPGFRSKLSALLRTLKIAFVAGIADDACGVPHVAVPELAFLDVAVALIGGTGTLSASLGVVVVADVEHHHF